mmetsp:Transcript_96160/g.206309  ORF Transcript_96160/g.206309 Transcript_96160/m.206309 type:complete len:358 (-) Transcript_96160:104-1177(-)
MKSTIAALKGAFATESDHGFLRSNLSESLNATGSWLQTNKICGNVLWDPCRTEAIHAYVVIIALCVTIVLMFCAFYFFREDKEEQITPLSPQLVVHGGDLKFSLPLDEKIDFMEVGDKDGEPMCKVVMDWPDPFRPGASGVTATVRLQSMQDQTLATVVARSLAVIGQGLALCRAGCEIFGFVEADGMQRYYVRHRTGVHLLTLTGDFDNVDIVGVNPVGSKVCSLKKENGVCKGSILQHVDAGLVICALLATSVHRRLHSNSHPSASERERSYSPVPITAPPVVKTEVAETVVETEVAETGATGAEEAQDEPLTASDDMEAPADAFAREEDHDSGDSSSALTQTTETQTPRPSAAG